jgi:hypothetical protein
VIVTEGRSAVEEGDTLGNGVLVFREGVASLESVWSLRESVGVSDTDGLTGNVMFDGDAEMVWSPDSVNDLLTVRDFVGISVADFERMLSESLVDCEESFDGVMESDICTDELDEWDLLSEADLSRLTEVLSDVEVDWLLDELISDEIVHENENVDEYEEEAEADCEDEKDDDEVGVEVSVFAASIMAPRMRRTTILIICLPLECWREGCSVWLLCCAANKGFLNVLYSRIAQRNKRSNALFLRSRGFSISLTKIECTKQTSQKHKRDQGTVLLCGVDKQRWLVVACNCASVAFSL